MYSLKEVANAQELRFYMNKIFQEMKIGPLEITEYNNQIKGCSFAQILEISQEYIDMLNNMKS